MASVRNRYGGFGLVIIFIVRQGVYRPFTVGILPDDRTINYDPIFSFRCFILCTGVVISVDIDRKVYRRCVGVYRSGRLEFLVSLAVKIDPVDRGALFFLVFIFPGNDESREAVHAERGRQFFGIHLNTAGLGRGVGNLFNRAAGNVADHDRSRVDRLGSHFGKAGFQDFQLNGDRTLRFDLCAACLTGKTDVISQHAVEAVALRQQGSFGFVPVSRILLEHADKEFDFLIESTLCNFSQNDHFVQFFCIDGLQRSERSDNDRFLNHRSLDGIVLGCFRLDSRSRSRRLFNRSFNRGRIFRGFLSGFFHRCRFLCRFFDRCRIFLRVFSRFFRRNFDRCRNFRRSFYGCRFFCRRLCRCRIVSRDLSRSRICRFRFRIRSIRNSRRILFFGVRGFYGRLILDL